MSNSATKKLEDLKSRAHIYEPKAYAKEVPTSLVEEIRGYLFTYCVERHALGDQAVLAVSHLTGREIKGEHLAKSFPDIFKIFGIPVMTTKRVFPKRGETLLYTFPVA